MSPPPGYERAEQKKDAFGFDRLGGVGYLIAAAIEDRTGFEARVSVLGHVQRGGSPSAFDRVLATRLGVGAADRAIDGESGIMVGLRSMKIESVPLSEAVDSIRGVPERLFHTAETFFG